MTKKTIIGILIALTFATAQLNAQDLAHYKQIVKELSSSKYQGRGYALFEEINNENHYFKALNRGELAANSDHYPFASRPVPCIFFENEEGDAFKYYHTIYDTYENAIFSTYEPIFKIVTDFIERY